MTYIPKYPTGLSGITDVLTAAKDVVQDPCLFEVAKLASTLHDLEQPSTGGADVPGIGLCHAVTPLKVIVYARQNPVVALAAAAGIIGTLVGIGYLLGQPPSRRKV